VLGHLVMVDHRTDRECDLVLAAQRPLGAPDAGLNVEQLLLGGLEHARGGERDPDRLHDAVLRGIGTHDRLTSARQQSVTV
jgi:hypothetical protein